MFCKRDFKILESMMMLYEVKNCKSKKSAAKKLNTSIDTLNKYLENLEDELGTKLILVNKHHCEFTQFGEKAVEAAEKIRVYLSDVYQEISAEKSLCGKIKIAYERNACLPELSLVYKEYPHISFCFDTFETASDIKNHSYDICLSYTKPTDEDSVVVYAREIPCYFFASEEYLRQHGRPQNADDIFLNHKLLLKEEFCSQVCFKNVSSLVSNNLFLIKDAVIHDAGIAVLPFLKAFDFGRLVCLKDVPCDIKCFLYLVSYSKIKDIPRVRAILNFYKKSLQKMTFT